MRLSHFTVKILTLGNFECRVNNLSLQWNFLRILQRLLLNGISRAFSRVSLIHRGRTDCHNAGRKHRCLKCEFKPKISKQPTRALIRYKAISLICAFILREFHWQRHVFFPLIVFAWDLKRNKSPRDIQALFHWIFIRHEKKKSASNGIEITCIHEQQYPKSFLLNGKHERWKFFSKEN